MRVLEEVKLPKRRPDALSFKVQEDVHWKPEGRGRREGQPPQPLRGRDLLTDQAKTHRQVANVACRDSPSNSRAYCSRSVVRINLVGIQMLSTFASFPRPEPLPSSPPMLPHAMPPPRDRQAYG